MWYRFRALRLRLTALADFEFPYGLRALNQRDFRLFWIGQLISLIGSWMQSVGQSWLVLELTGSPFKLGLIGTLQFLPVLLFSPLAGAYIDRLPKRRVLLVTQTTLMVLAFAMTGLVYAGHIQYWHIAIMALVLGVVNTIDMPARQAFVVELSGREALANAIALNSAIFNGARLIGPAAAGALIGLYGTSFAFLINGISFLAVLAALFAIHAEGAPTYRHGESVLKQIGEGIRFTVQTPLILLALSTLLVVSLFVLNWNVLVPLMAKQMLGMQAQGYGFLMSALGAGALLGALILAGQSRDLPRLSVVMGSAVIVSAASIGIGFVHHPWVAAALLFVIGVAQILFSAGINTTVQMTTPDNLRGRVMSLYIWVFAGAAPFGSFYMGAVTEVYGAASGFMVGGSLGLIATLGLLGWWALRQRRAEADRPAD